MYSQKIEYLLDHLQISCEQLLDIDFSKTKVIIRNCIRRVEESTKLTTFQKRKIIHQLKQKEVEPSQLCILFSKLLLRIKLKFKDFGNLLLFSAKNNRDVLSLFTQIENSLTSLRSQSKSISLISHFQKTTKIPKFLSRLQKKPELDITNLENGLLNINISKL